MVSFDQLLKDLKNKIYHPVYFLDGEEPYFLDILCSYIEDKVLSETEKEFNLTVLYGKETDLLSVISYAKRYPMLSSYQVVIVKEAQSMRDLVSKDFDGKENKHPLIEYLQQPQTSTILVFCYKYKNIDKRSQLYKALSQKAIVFRSERVKDYKIKDWIVTYVQSKDQHIHDRAATVMAEYLGNDLSKIANEIDKLILNLKPGFEIDLNLVQNHIGISKEFNVFELQSALGKKNIFKSNQIAEYFSRNQKSNPLAMTLPVLYSYFMKILAYHRLPAKGRSEVASALGVNPYFVQDYEIAARSYSENKLIEIIGNLRDCDVKYKGYNSTAGEGPLLKELIYRILH